MTVLFALLAPVAVAAALTRRLRPAAALVAVRAR